VTHCPSGIVSFKISKPSIASPIVKSIFHSGHNIESKLYFALLFNSPFKSNINLNSSSRSFDANDRAISFNTLISELISHSGSMVPVSKTILIFLLSTTSIFSTFEAKA